MSQKYYNTYIGIGRATQSSYWSGYPIDQNQIDEFNNSTTLQNALIVDQSDGNQEIYHEMVLIPDATNYVAFDETYTPVSGDHTYNTKFIALVKESGSTVYTLYTSGSQDVYFSTDKLTFLATLRQEYGDGKFRIFQNVVQSHSHSFVTVP